MLDCLVLYNFQTKKETFTIHSKAFVTNNKCIDSGISNWNGKSYGLLMISSKFIVSIHFSDKTHLCIELMKLVQWKLFKKTEKNILFETKLVVQRRKFHPVSF